MVGVVVVILTWSRRSAPTAGHDIGGLFDHHEASQHLSSQVRPRSHAHHR